MIITRKEFNLDRVNLINGNERHYHDTCYKITVAISNAINPTFLIYAYHLQDALETLSDYNDKNEFNLFIDHYDLMDIIDDNEELERFYQCDNGMYIDMDYIYAEEIKRNKV